MAFTKVTAAGINTGGSFVLENINTSGIITASAVNVGSAVTISSSGANVTGIVTAGTVQVGSATTIHTTGIDLGGGTLTSHNINSTGIITATSGFDGNLTGNVTGDLTGNVTGNVSSSGANTLGSLTVTNDATVGGALTVTGDFTVNGTTTTIDTIVTAVDSLAVDGNVTAGGNLDITGISTFQNDVNFAGATGVTSAFFDKSDNSLKFFDSTKAKFGTGNDLEIYHDGTHSHVREVGTGDLRLRSSKIQLMNPSSEPYFIGNSDGAVELYYDNSKKFETTGTGVTITGDARVTGILTVGTASVTIDGSQDFPTIRPTLDLNFAATKTLDRRITFTRDSIATYTDELGIVKYASNNVPRFDHDPETGESLGLLVEESRTNLVTYSEDLGNWSSTLWTITTDAIAAPDGNTTADLAVPNLGTSTQARDVTVSVTSGVQYVATIFAKAKEMTSFSLRPTGSNSYRCTFTLTGSGTAAPTNGSGSITVLPNGWYKCVYAFTEPTGGSRQFGVQTEETSDGVSGFYVWGAQLEAGSFPTSYIPTSGSTVTRAADLAKITGSNFSNWHNETEGTIFVSVDSIADGSNTGIVSLDDGGIQNYINIQHSLTPKSYFLSRDLNNIQFSVELSEWNSGNRLLALAYQENNFAATENGATPYVDTSATVATVNQLQIGTFGNNINSYGIGKATFSKISYYNKRLTNAQLQSLTRQ